MAYHAVYSFPDETGTVRRRKVEADSSRKALLIVQRDEPNCDYIWVFGNRKLAKDFEYKLRKTNRLAIQLRKATVQAVDAAGLSIYSKGDLVSQK